MAFYTKNKSWLISIGLVLLTGLFFIYKQNNTNRLDWRMSLEDNSEEPYGTLIFKRLLKQQYGKENFYFLDKKLAESLDTVFESHANFIFLGEAMLLDSNDISVLLNFVRKGSIALISSTTVPDALMEQIYAHSHCDDLPWEDHFIYFDTALSTNFVHPNLKEQNDFVFPFIHNQEVTPTYWQAFSKHSFCQTYPTIICQSADSLVHMAMFTHGKGRFYFQTAPITFTNYYLTKESGRNYTEKIMTHFGEGPVLWDGFSNVPASLGRSKNRSGVNPLEPQKGPLNYILSQPPLAWAWYLLLVMALLYLFFRAKRYQRVIPVLPQNRNTSLEFISTIGQLHYATQNHHRIAIQKMDLLRSFIRTKYGLSANKPDTEFISKLSALTEVDPNTLQKIFLINKNIQRSSFVTAKTLIELHKLIHYFYRHCK